MSSISYLSQTLKNYHSQQGKYLSFNQEKLEVTDKKNRLQGVINYIEQTLSNKEFNEQIDAINLCQIKHGIKKLTAHYQAKNRLWDRFTTLFFHIFRRKTERQKNLEKLTFILNQIQSLEKTVYKKHLENFFSKGSSDPTTTKIESYIQKHFDVIANNAPLSQVQVFCLGEYHTKDSHALKNGWMIDHLHQEGDAVLVEGVKPGEKGDKLYSQIRFVEKEVHAYGWDDRPPMNNEDDQRKLVKLITYFNLCKSKLSKTHVDFIIKELKGIKQENYIQYIPAKTLDYICQLDSRILLQVCTYLLHHQSYFTCKYKVKYLNESWQTRQTSLSKSLVDAMRKQDKKVFMTAGSLHFFENSQIEQYLEPILTQYPFAILMPKDHINEREQAKIAKRIADCIKKLGLEEFAKAEQISKESGDTDPEFLELLHPIEDFAEKIKKKNLNQEQLKKIGWQLRKYQLQIASEYIETPLEMPLTKLCNFIESIPRHEVDSCRRWIFSYSLKWKISCTLLLQKIRSFIHNFHFPLKRENPLVNR